MAVIIIRTHHCPMCKRRIDPLLGLIMKPYIQCPKCPTRVYVSRDMVIHNWSHNFVLICALLIWVGLIFYAPYLPQKGPQKAGPGAMMVGMLLLGWLPGLLCSLPLIPVGYVLGHVVALFVATGPPQPQYTPPPAGGYGSGRVPQEHEWR